MLWGRIESLADAVGLVAFLFQFEVVEPIPVVRDLDWRLAAIRSVHPDFRAGRIACDCGDLADTTTGTAEQHQGVPMRRDDEVEQIAMNVVMQYEKRRGWTPYDVSQDGEHYDIRSESPTSEVRYIEVKGRAASGPIILTSPEMDKLKQLGPRAYLYIVTYCRGERPRLRIINDPMRFLSPEMLFRQIQYLVQENDWSRFGENTEI